MNINFIDISKMNYNFVFWGLDNDYYHISMKDFREHSNTRYIEKVPLLCNKPLRILHKIHFSNIINRHISLPFKSIWNPFYFKDTFKDNKPLCFIFSGRYANFAKAGLITYLRKKHPESKFVCFFQDLIATHPKITIEEAKTYYDLVISYDKEEAEKYGVLYHPTLYSSIEVENNPLIEASDIYFLGAAKNRLEKILLLYTKFVDAGYKCDFNIAGVSVKDRKYIDGINYINHMSYYENLQHIEKTKAIIEIMQEGARGHTLRMWEAIAYNKYLITDNSVVELYNEDGFILADNFFTNEYDIRRVTSYGSEIKKKYSVDDFILLIENYLSNS